jgi:hypothetical protein
MIDEQLFIILLGIWSAVAVGTFIVLFFISAPYGKMNRKGWGAVLSNRVSWILMESVSLGGMIFLFFTGNNRDIPYLFFFFLWAGHYSYRSLIFPFLRKNGSAVTMPILVIFFGMCFNAANSFFNGYYLFHFEDLLGTGWVFDFRFLLGASLFIAGFILNFHSDRILRNLRKAGETSYKIPYGGFFRFISCPNYFGEILEWAGWAVATWSFAGLSFALWTIANLAPRAFSYHTWYKKTFKDYPRERKALIPFIV